MVKIKEGIDAGSIGQQDRPPSWEEVMQKKEKSEKHEEKVPITDVEAIADNEAEALTAMQKLVVTSKRVLVTFRKIVQWGTILSDAVFVLFSLATLIVGCLILQKHFEIVRVVDISQFSTIGHTLVVISSLNLGVFGPFGLIGVWKSKKLLLKWHNIWLLLNILIQLAFLYMCFHFLHKSEMNRKKAFSKSFKTIYNYCYFNETSGTCCCNRGNVPTCWESDKNPKNSLYWDGERFENFNENDMDFNTYLRRLEILRTICRTDLTDYYGKAIKAMEDGFFCLAGAIIVEGFTLFFGTLTFLIAEYPEVHDDEETPKKIEVKREKRGLGIFKKVLIFFIVKRLFLFCLASVFFVCYYFLKKVTENVNIEVPVGGGTANVTLWKLITAIMCSFGFGSMHIQLIEDDDTKKRRKRRKIPKGKLGKIVQKTKYFACRRALLVVFGLLFFLGVIFWKLWKKNFKVKLGYIENIDVIEVIWYQVRKLFIDDKAE